jgi:dihydroorotase
MHIAHVSSQRGMQVVEWFKQQGAPITAEVTPHHLTLTDDVLSNFDAVAKVAPPLRTQADVDYLIDAIRRGIVDSIGTDHAPHTRAEKEADMLDAPFGIGNIEVCFPLLYTRLVEGGHISLQQLIALLTTGPARVMNWELPTLVAGRVADIVLLDLSTERAVAPRQFKSKARFSPWTDWQLKGWPVATYRAGEPIYRAEQTATVNS